MWTLCNSFLSNGPAPARRRRRPAGFSLIELMVAVTVVGILTSLAYPSYSRYVIRANRSAAQQFLLEVASRQEQHLLDARRYATSLADLQVSVPPEVSRHYQSSLSVDNSATPPVYRITAEPIAGTLQAADPVLSLSSSGLRTPVDHW